MWESRSLPEFLRRAHRARASNGRPAARSHAPRGVAISGTRYAIPHANSPRASSPAPVLCGVPPDASDVPWTAMVRQRLRVAFAALVLSACQGGQNGLACPPCPSSAVCVDDPRDTCDPRRDLCPAVCVSPDPQCGGIAGRSCPPDMTCVDDPRDDCDPAAGGADCSGLCAPK